MKIIVKSGKFRLWLWFPLSMLKTKMIRRGFSENVLKGNGDNNDSSKCSNEGLAEEHCEMAQAEELQSEDGFAVSVEVETRDETETEASQKHDEASLQVVHDDALDEKAMDAQLKAQFKQAYAILKQYVKQNGHFTLLEVETSEKDTYIKIRV